MLTFQSDNGSAQHYRQGAKDQRDRARHHFQLTPRRCHLADELDFESLPKGRPDRSTLDLVRLPGDSILDVSRFYSAYEPKTTWCDDFVHLSFDRGPRQYLISEGAYWLNPINRRISLVLPAGKEVLQYTRRSEAGFYASDRTPGWIP